MSTFPVTPRGPRKGGFGLLGILVVLAFLGMAGYFVYNMLPNAVSAIVPGASPGGIKGEWVGLVTYQENMMSNLTQPAAVKLNFAPTEMTSIIPTYKVSGELMVAGHTVPATFTVHKMMTGHLIVSLNGEVDESSDPALKGGMITGEVADKKMTFEVHSMTAGSTADVKGTLQSGSDADYEALKKQLK